MGELSMTDMGRTLENSALTDNTSALAAEDDDGLAVLEGPLAAPGGGDYDAWGDVPIAAPDAVTVPESACNYCDTWGNFTKQPVKTIEENRDKNFIKVFIYKHEKHFYYGYQLKLEKVIRQKKANIFDPPLETEEKAMIAARKDLIALTSEKKLNKIFISFEKICYNQPELF
jgi:hypothetical protein